MIVLFFEIYVFKARSFHNSFALELQTQEFSFLAGHTYLKLSKISHQSYYMNLHVHVKIPLSDPY